MAMLLITHDLTIVRKVADRVCVMTDGQIVETGPVDEVFERPQHAYTQHLLAAEPKGRPPGPAPRRAGGHGRRSALKVHFPIQRGLLRRTVGHVKAVDGVDLTRAARPDGRRGRRERLGQDHARPGAAAPDPERGRHPLSGPGRSRAGRRAGCGRCGATCRSCSRIPTAASRRACRSGRSSRRGYAAPASAATAQGRRRLVAKVLEEVGLDPDEPGPLPARVLGRPAPADQHRPGDRARAELRRARRADLGARHVGAGADRRPAARPAGAPRAGLHVHQPRPARGARAQRQVMVMRDGQVVEQGPAQEHLRAPAAPLHPRPDGGGLRHRGRRQRIRRGLTRPPPRGSPNSTPNPWKTAVGACVLDMFDTAAETSTTAVQHDNAATQQSRKMDATS